MFIYSIPIYILFFALLGTGLISLLARHPITSILALILSFIIASVLCLLCEAEFLALIILVVYVGAIAVLFLFVIMMMNVRLTEISEKLLGYLPFSIILACLFSLCLFTILAFNTSFTIGNSSYISWIITLQATENIFALGQLLYTIYWPLFIISGLMLLLALVSAVVLTLKTSNIKTEIKSQLIFKQVNTPFIRFNSSKIYTKSLPTNLCQ